MRQFRVSLFFASMLLISPISHAYTQTELETFDNEPPIVKDLLERASVLVGDENNADSAWQAANL